MIKHTEIVKNYKGMYECEVYQDGKYICKIQKRSKADIKECIKSKGWEVYY